MSAHGIYAAVVTATDERGAIQTKPTIRHARWLLENGCHGLGIFGTTSETNCFSVSERQQALEAYVNGGLDPDCMIVGVGACARSDSEALTRHALEIGAKRVLLMPPFFYKNPLQLKHNNEPACNRFPALPLVFEQTLLTSL